MSVKDIGEKKYPVKTIVRPFKYFSPSRNSYNRLREDFQLLSLGTLTRLTPKVRSLDDA